MVWSLETSNGYESAKIAAVAAQYLQGSFLDLGCGPSKVWPSALGIDNGSLGGQGEADIVGDIADLHIFADESFDHVFSSHALEDFERERVPAVLSEWAGVIKVGGHLVLYLPSANLYPTLGKPGANKAHKWDIFPGDVEAILKDVNSGNWTLLESEERSGTNEYSLFIVARKEAPGHGWKEQVWERNPGGKKRVLVIRYGQAIGDMLIASSLLPGLQAKGFHVTFNTTPQGQDTLLHDPHIDQWMLQDKDFVPNQQLGPYWEGLGERYDQVVNLCESIEGWFLTMQGRLTHRHSDNARRRLYGKSNYLEIAHDIADIPYEFASKFYPTAEEVTWAAERRAEIPGPVITWVIHGSSHHKTSPHIHHVLTWLLQRSPCSVVLMGDNDVGKLLADMIMTVLNEECPTETHRVRNMTSGAWSRRQALAFSQVSDCIVGPETGILNGMAHEAMPKIVYLSHSSPDNLTKNWTNTITLVPPLALAPCFPCHKLHYGWETCHRDPETAAALCAAGVSALDLFVAIATAMGATRSDQHSEAAD